MLKLKTRPTIVDLIQCHSQEITEIDNYDRTDFILNHIDFLCIFLLRFYRGLYNVLSYASELYLSACYPNYCVLQYAWGNQWAPGETSVPF